MANTQLVMNRIRWIVPLLGLTLFVISHRAAAAHGDCGSETAVSGREDVVLCEPWEQTDWYSAHGFVDSARGTVDANEVSNAEILTSGCVSGSCLRVHMRKGSSNGISLKWLLAKASLQPEQLYMRYYLRLSSNFDGMMCNDSGQVTGSGGKFPGLSHDKINTDPGGQCGNGGEYPDPPLLYPNTPDVPQGRDCWSGRLGFDNCVSGGHNVCNPDSTDRERWGSQLPEPKPAATTRIYTYSYFPGQTTYTGTPAFWDQHPWNQFSGNGNTCETEPNNTFCGIGNHGMLENDRWYSIELYVKMNTVGQANGIMRAWVDGALALDKTNMIYRREGHDEIHVPTFWLNVFTGGLDGNCHDQWIDMDQLVLATGSQIGTMSGVSTVKPAAPTNLQVQ